MLNTVYRFKASYVALRLLSVRNKKLKGTLDFKGQNKNERSRKFSSWDLFCKQLEKGKESGGGGDVTNYTYWHAMRQL